MIDHYQLKHLTKGHKEFAQAMSDISERCYCSGWLYDLENVLWRVIQGCSQKYRGDGVNLVTRNEILLLKKLSRENGGWIRYSQGVGPMFVPLDGWVSRPWHEVSIEDNGN